MEESFFQKLQRVKIGDIGHVFLFVPALPVALIYRLFSPCIVFWTFILKKIGVG